MYVCSWFEQEFRRWPREPWAPVRRQAFVILTSALVKHYHAEAGTAVVDQIIGMPGAELFIARVTLVETISAFATKVRTGAFDPVEFARLRGLFATHVARRRYQVVRLFNAHYDRAQDLVTSSGLTRQVRPLDVLQLAVTLHLHRMASLDHFVYADERLCDIAALEGLAVLNPELP